MFLAELDFNAVQLGDAEMERKMNRVRACNEMGGMSGLVFGIHVAHGEGLLHFPDAAVRNEAISQKLVPLVYADDSGAVTEAYPFNPNGSPDGFAGLCSPDGRHLALMPHPERAFLPWQCHWLPRELRGLEVSPWLRMFQNAREWCVR